MDTKEIKETLAELLSAYDKYRALWVESFGTDEGFDKWFTAQVVAQ